MRPDQIAKTQRRARQVAGAATAADDAAIQAEAAAAPRDLSDPATQFRILNPKEMRYPLHLDDGSVREIAVKTEFTLHDIHDVGILDALEAFTKLVQYEIAQVDGGAVRDSMDTLRSRRLDIAMSRRNVRADARNLLFELSRFATPFEAPSPVAGEKPFLRERPTLGEIATGMDSVQLSAASLFLVNRYYEEVGRRKNALGTAPSAA